MAVLATDADAAADGGGGQGEESAKFSGDIEAGAIKTPADGTEDDGGDDDDAISSFGDDSGDE